ncbi:hypothetical protein V2J09_000677 [Rumex salicifolius]
MDPKSTIVLLVGALMVAGGCLGGTADPPPQFSAMFVFGDSLVDSGNNNFLNSLAKANYIPYGMDFFSGPTGRFSNGKTFIDYLAELLDLPHPVNYINTSGDQNILKGVNYASASAGILDETGQTLGERYSLNKQVLNFESTLDQLKRGMKEGDVYQLLGDALVVMVLGSNDYLNNYLLPTLYQTSTLYNPQDYANLLINHYARQVEALYSLGFRQFFLVGVGPLGCIPNQRATGGGSPPGGCVTNVNDMVMLFNTGLSSLADQLNTNHQDGVFAYGDTYNACMDIFTNPATYGIRVVDSGCCGVGRNNGQMTCLPLSIPCSNRSEYVFWDAFHPTEVVNQILAQKAYNGPITSPHPPNHKTYKSIKH